jgi:DNA-binding transcriptional LysR family regulator
MLDVRRLRVLRSVVTSGSVTAAAANLGYTPSAISQQLAVLEREAGLPLLEKSGRGVRATSAGDLLAEHAGLIMSRLSAAESALADLREGRTGALSVRYFATAGASLVPPAIARWRREFPGVQLDLKLHEPAYSTAASAEGEADVELVVLSEVPDTAGVRVLHLLDDPYAAVLPKGHRLARKRVVDLAALEQDSWVDNEWPPGVCRQIMIDACAAAGFNPEFVVESDDYPTAMAFVASGLGVTLVPRIALGSVPSGVVVRPIRRPQPVRSIYVSVRGAILDTPPVQGLLTALRAAAAG